MKEVDSLSRVKVNSASGSEFGEVDSASGSEVEEFEWASGSEVEKVDSV